MQLPAISSPQPPERTHDAQALRPSGTHAHPGQLSAGFLPSLLDALFRDAPASMPRDAQADRDAEHNNPAVSNAADAEEQGKPSSAGSEGSQQATSVISAGQRLPERADRISAAGEAAAQLATRGEQGELSRAAGREAVNPTEAAATREGGEPRETARPQPHGGQTPAQQPTPAPAAPGNGAASGPPAAQQTPTPAVPAPQEAPTNPAGQASNAKQAQPAARVAAVAAAGSKAAAVQPQPTPQITPGSGSRDASGHALGRLASLGSGLAGRLKTKSTEPTPQPPDREAAVRQVQRAMSQLLSGEGGRVVVKLRPEALGEVLVALQVAAGEVRGRIDAKNEQARRLLEAGLPQLRAALESRGLAVQALEVIDPQAQAGEPGLPLDADAERGAPNHGERGPHRTPASAGDAGGEEQSDAPTPGAAPRWTALGLDTVV